MRNPVAHEVQVIATGARPGDNSAKRELFTELTSTVLVFENGAVIRLTAAVASGQLLFLTNQESKREVVAQVMCKRSFRPTCCYVELEFTEPAPGFWGIEFPATPEAAAADPRQTGVFELVQEAEVTSENPSEPASARTPDEVDRLKREVASLREQLQSLRQSQSLPAVVNPLGALPEPTPAPATVPATAPQPAPVYAAAPATKSAPSPAPAPELVRAVRMQLPTADPAYIPAPPAPNPNLQKPASPFDSNNNFSEEAILSGASSDPVHAESSIWNPALAAQERKARARSRATLITLLSTALLLVSIGTAFYRHWLPQPKFFSSASRTTSVLAATPASTGPSTLRATVEDSEVPQPATPVPAASAAAASPNAPSSTSPSDPASAPVNASPSNSPDDPTDPGDSDAGSQAIEKPASPAPFPKRSHLPIEKSTTATASEASTETPDIVPPQLLHSVRPVPPPEAVRGFVTGNVKVDALVDSSGRVTSISVLSGPASLRNAAIEAVKQYKYAPATRNSAPVSAHVTLTVQFWYEP